MAFTVLCVGAKMSVWKRGEKVAFAKETPVAKYNTIGDSSFSSQSKSTSLGSAVCENEAGIEEAAEKQTCPLPPGCTVTYSLPFIRFTMLLTLLLITDWIVTTVMWLTGE